MFVREETSGRDELALIDGVAAGDTDAFERLFRLYERRVFQYILGFVRNAATAEEIAADAMLAVWHNAARFEKAARVSTWIFGIARHKAIDAMRRAMRALPTEPLEEAWDLPSAAPGPMEEAQGRTVEQLTQRVFEHLSAEHREVLYLAYVEDVPYEEIAILLDVPRNTVKTRVFYAKRKLREYLERITPVESVR